MLPHGFTVLAPMDGVTDVVFRQIVTSVGKPDVLFTEFVNCDGLMSVGQERVMQRLLFKKNEHPLVAQIWGINPETFYESAKLIVKLGFDGIDINMGCPQRTVTNGGACAALIKNKSLAKEIIEATKKGSQGLPVSVKTRIGFSKNQIDEWIQFLLEQNLSALTIHLRTAKELSLVPAHWELMGKIVEMRNSINPNTILIGNGDVKNLQEAKEKSEQYGCDGVMIGRGIFSDPWLFNEKVDKDLITVEQKLDLYMKHINLFEDTWGKDKNPASLKKFCKVYINEFPGAGEVREKIMLTESLDEMKKLITQYLIKNSADIDEMQERLEDSHPS